VEKEHSFTHIKHTQHMQEKQREGERMHFFPYYISFCFCQENEREAERMRRIRERDQEIEEKTRNRAKVEEEESMPDAKLRDDRHPEELHAGMKEMKDKFDEHARRMATARKEFEDKFALRQKEIEERMEHILKSLSFGTFVYAGIYIYQRIHF
jgi:hypothetical protein